MSYLKVTNILNPSAGNIAMVTDILGNTQFGGNVGIGTGGGNISFNGSALVIGTQNAVPIQFRTSGSQQVVIDANGNLGIGTQSPSSYGTGVTYYSNTNGTTGFTAINAGTSAGSISSILVGSAVTGGVYGYMLYNGSGVPSGSSVYSNPNAFVIGAGAFATSGLQIGHSNAYPIKFYTSNLEQMRLDSSGNLGIGTPSPAFKLDVSGTIRASSDTGIQLRNSANQFIGALITPFGWGVSSGSTTDISVAAANNLTFFSGNNVTERMRITSAGNVGIGTITVSAGNAVAVFGGNIQIGSTGNGLRFADGTYQSTAYTGAVTASGSLVKISYLTSGTSFTTQSTTNHIYVQLIGAGGGGGGAGSTGSGYYGCGGGGGAYGQVYVSVSPSTTYTIAIGSAGAAGGSGANSGGNGGNGGSTSITIGVTTYTAGGGSGGAYAVASALSSAGGTATNCDFSIPGSGGSGGNSGTTYKGQLNGGPYYAAVSGSGVSSGSWYGQGGGGGTGAGSGGTSGYQGFMVITEYT
jgi:hypothetical protein